MTDNAHIRGSIDVLDFPGADDLIAAGRVEPPSAQVVEAARAQVSAGAVVVPWKRLVGSSHAAGVCSSRRQRSRRLSRVRWRIR